MTLRSLLLLTATAAIFAACREREVQTDRLRIAHRHHSQKINGDLAIPVGQKVLLHDSICIAAVGDIMLGTSYPDKSTLPPDSAKGSFKNVMYEFRGADVLFGNLEGTLLDTGTPAHFKLHQLSKPYLFRMPGDYGKTLKNAGFNVVSLANNHISDFGDNGRISTMHILDGLGINFGGQVSHPSAVFNVHGVTYGFCAFAPNGYTLPILDLHRATRIIRHLKAKCDIVIISFHGGGEGIGYEHTPPGMELFIKEKRGDVRAFTHAAIDAGADLIFGNGPHVCRGMEVQTGKPTITV